MNRKISQALGCSLSMLLMAIANPGHAAVSEDLQYQYYRVVVEGNETLLEALNRATPIKIDNQFFHAHTHWNVRWHAQWSEASNSHCGIIDIEVELTTNMQLPRLTQASPQVHDIFNNYSKHLLTHELGHHNIGRKAAFAVERYLLKDHREKTCSKLESKLERGIQDILQGHAQKDRDYDLDTGHGKKQGAYLHNN